MTLLKNKFLLFSLLSIYLFAWFSQDILIFNPDVSWFMLATKRMLAGGSYTHDFFEINPPMILYLTVPAVMLMQFLAITADIAVRIYIFFLSTLSLYLCFNLLNKIFASQHKLFTIISILSLATLFLLLPVGAFAQREHILIILTIPYFLLITLRLQASACSVFTALGIGIMAGCAFAIKPYFLLSLFLVEIYYCYTTRRLFAWLRPETFAIFGVFISYACLIIWLHSDYLTLVLPLITKFYYQKFSSSLINILRDQDVIFTGFMIIFYWLSYHQFPYKKLGNVLLLASVGFTIAFIIQRTHWYYHALPAFALNCWLLILLFQSWILPNNYSKLDYIRATALGLLSLAYLFFYQTHLALSLAFYPSAYFSFFSILFAWLFYSANLKENLSTLVLRLSLALALAGLFYLNGVHTLWREHLFLLTTILLILLFYLCMPNPAKRIKFTYFALLGMVFFAYPFHHATYIYHYTIETKKIFEPYYQFIRTFDNHSIYFFTNSGDYAFPINDYTRLNFPSRFGCLSWVPSLRMEDSQAVYQQAYAQQASAMAFFISAVAEDLSKYHPDYVFIDVRKSSSTPQLGYFGNDQLDYLRFFLLNPSFQHVWKNYRYLKTVDGQPVYKFRIYQKI